MITSFHQEGTVNLQLVYKKQSILSDTLHPQKQKLFLLHLQKVLLNQYIFKQVNTKSEGGH